MSIAKHVLFASLAWVILGLPSIQASNFDDSKISHIAYPDWFINNPFLELDEDLAAAQSSGKQGLMVVYSTEGCSYCDQFIQKSLSDPTIASMVKKHFNAVGLEIFDDTNLISPQGQKTSVKEFATQEGVMFSPSILFYDTHGQRVLRITGYQSPERFKTSLNYVIGKHYESQTLAEYVKSLTSSNARSVSTTHLRSDPLFVNPPYLLQRNLFPASTPLLVIFETGGCMDCDIFHDQILANKQIRDSLKHYEVVRLDTRDNKTAIIKPDGSRTTPANWFREENFTQAPALMFFSETGNAEIKTDNLVLQQRMMNSINFMNDRAYTKGWSYQRYARSKAIEKSIKKSASKY